MATKKMKLLIDSYVVVDCNNKIIAMDSEFQCRKMANTFTKKGYRDNPFRVEKVCCEI